MYIQDIEKIQSLLYDLKSQMEKQEALNGATNIHVTFNGPSQNQVRMNFSASVASIASSEYDWSDARAFVETVLKERVDSLMRQLEAHAVKIDV